MNIKQNPFSLYDFLGYLMPGALFIYICLAIYWHIDPNISIKLNLEEFSNFKRLEIYLPFIVIAYICGHLLSFCSSATVETYANLINGYPSKYLLGLVHRGYLNSSGKSFIKKVFAVLLWVFLFPIAIYDCFFGTFLGLRKVFVKPLDHLLRATIRKRIEDLIRSHAGILNKEDYGKARSVDFFRYIYHFAVENAPSHLPKMQNYVALYGFLRTMTFIFVLLFWAQVLHIFIVFNCLYTSFIAITSVITYLFYLAFFKFMRRFTLETLMAMAVTYKPEEKGGWGIFKK